MSTWTLYNINKEIQELLWNAEEYDDETFRDTWEALTLERRQKIDDTLSAYKALKTWAEGCKAEAKVLKERADKYERQAENITTRLQGLLEDGETFKSSRHELSYRKSTSTNVTVDPQMLPEPYRRISYAANKTAIKEALESGETIPGCSLERKTNVIIR